MANNRMATSWLSRLEATARFTSLTRAEERAAPLRTLGGLCGGSVPEAVRQSHGWAPLIPADAPSRPRQRRRGDFFRCE